MDIDEEEQDDEMDTGEEAGEEAEEGGEEEGEVGVPAESLTDLQLINPYHPRPFVCCPGPD